MEAIVPLLFIGLIIAIFVIRSNRQIDELRRAKQNYHRSLDELKANPTNPDVRQNTLSLGRHYSALTRENRNVTIFDEMALMNDIGAACAGAASSNSLPQITPPSSIEGRLARLNELKRKGLIDEEEYASQRQKILDEV